MKTLVAISCTVILLGLLGCGGMKGRGVGAITGAGAGANSATIYVEDIDIQPCVAGDSLGASTYYTFVYDTDLGTTDFHWTGKGSDATEAIDQRAGHVAQLRPVGPG